jgi:para-nitrobenzyl esterase
VNTTATTTTEQLRGQVEEGVVVFRGVPYARCERFGPPLPVTAWDGERAATEDGPVAPQLPSRLEPVMGAPDHHEQSEDCLSLTITTPGTAGARPVLVWFHGGAWVSGAGSWKFYGGHRLAREGDVVVVTVNYRLGILGYLHSPGVSDGNLGLAEQLCALRWVHDNIAAFGGDPDAVTIAGQSAGAHSVQCLIGMPQTRGLFRRAIMQSSPAGLGLGSLRGARRAARRFAVRRRALHRTAIPHRLRCGLGECAHARRIRSRRYREVGPKGAHGLARLHPHRRALRSARLAAVHR